MNKRKHVEELLYIRAICAIGIFTIHATGVFAVLSDLNSKVEYLATFLNQFFRFGTPVFITISGFVLFYNYRSMAEFNIKAFAKKKLLFIVMPYIIWSIVYFIFTAYMYSVNINFEAIELFLYKLIVGNTYSHLYFIFLVVQFYILFPIILKYLGEHMKKKPMTILFTCLVLQVSLLVYEYYFKSPTSNLLLGLFNKYYWKSIFGWFFYFIFGGIIAFHYEKFLDYMSKNIKMFLLGYFTSVILFLGEVYLCIYVYFGRGYYDNLGSIRPMNIVYSVFTFCMLLYWTRRIIDLNNPITNIFKSFGTYSLGIYFAHPLVLEYFKIRLFGYFPSFFGYSRLSSLIVIVIVGFVLTIGLCYLISFFRIRWLFLGKVPCVSNVINKFSKFDSNKNHSLNI